MAYDFGGTGSDDAIITNLTAHNTLRSYGLWTYREGDGEGGTGRMFEKRDNEAQVEFFAIFGPDNVYSYRREWSGSSTDWKITKPSLNAWHHILIVYDSGDVTNNAIIYVDGVSQTVTEANAPSGTPNTNSSAYLLGNRKAPTDLFNRTWDGRLCEWAVWNRLLTADEAAILGKGFSPLFIPDGLIRYSPLIRSLNDRLDNGAQTVNGTPTVIAHPPIIYPTQLVSGFAAAAAGGVVLLDGTAAAVSSLVGDLPVDKALGGTVPAVAALAGDLPVSRLMVSTVAAVSSLAGALPVDRGLASTVPATSSLAGALALEWALAGTVPAASTLTGDLTVPGEIVLSGVIPATSSLAGELPVERLMVSTIAAASTLDATLGKYRAINGSIDAVSTLAGDLQRLRALAGVVAGGSTLAGALKLEWALRGILAGAAAVSGDLTVELGFPWTRERLLTAKDISGPALRAPHRKEIE